MPDRRDTEHEPLLGPTPRHQLSDDGSSDDEDMDVHPVVFRIRNDLLLLVDTPLSAEQISSPAIIFSIIRPLEDKYFDLKNEAIIFALLVNRVQFISDQSHGLTLHSVNATRATICEILATNLLRRVHAYDMEKETSSGTKQLTDEEEATCLLKSANILAKAFSPFQGASHAVLECAHRTWGEESDLLKMRTNAVEMAIIGEAKQFIRSPACQRVIEGIWTGRIVYSSSTFIDIIPDFYKRRPVSLYNPHKASLLNHYRLTVPRIRATLEYFHYGILIASYVMMLQTRNLDRVNWFEAWFIVYTLGFGLDKVAAILEHGWRVFLANLWNGFDSVFIVIYLIYLVLRVIGLHSIARPPAHESWANEQSHQILSCAALLIFPRLAFVGLSDNILVLSLRAMLSDFVFLMLLAAWCFVGFVYSLWLLGEGEFSIGSIARWMVYVFFGLDGTGIRRAPEFHPILGPGVWVLYACLSNTLLVTVLVSILSKIFADVSMDATAETLYRRTVLTFEGVKSDALFNYQPPFNLLAVVFLLPLRFILTPRKFHSVHVFCTRVVNLPILLLIAFSERHLLRPKLNRRLRPGASGRTSARIAKNMRRFGAHAMIRAAFETDDDMSGEQTLEDEDVLVYLRERDGSETVTGRMDHKNRKGQGGGHRHHGKHQGGNGDGARRPQGQGGFRHPQSALARLFVPPSNLGPSRARFPPQTPDTRPGSPASDREPRSECNTTLKDRDKERKAAASPLSTPRTKSTKSPDVSSEQRPARPGQGSSLGRPQPERAVSASRPASIIQNDGSGQNDDGSYLASVEDRLQQMQTAQRARMDRLEDGMRRIEDLLRSLSHQE